MTTRQLKSRLDRELEKNVALRMAPVDGAEAYAVRGAGVLHLAVLIETMRREGYEMSVGKPRVVTRMIDGKVNEPFRDPNRGSADGKSWSGNGIGGLSTRYGRRDDPARYLYPAAI